MSVREVHVAGYPIVFAGRQRQRCAWCGAVIDDVDLTRMAFAIPEGKTEEQARADGDFRYASWPLGALIGGEGGVTYVIDEGNSGEVTVPDDSCLMVDPAVTS